MSISLWILDVVDSSGLHLLVTTQHLIQLKVLVRLPSSSSLSVYLLQNFQGCWLQGGRGRPRKSEREKIPQKPFLTLKTLHFWKWNHESSPNGCCSWSEAMNNTFLSVTLTLLTFFFSLMLPLLSLAPLSLYLLSADTVSGMCKVRRRHIFKAVCENQFAILMFWTQSSLISRVFFNHKRAFHLNLYSFSSSILVSTTFRAF